MQPSRAKCLRVCGVVGLVGLASTLMVGILLLCTGNQIFNWIYRTQLVLSPTAGSFPLWHEIPPLTAKMFLFNVTNPENVSSGALPIVEERGPYVFLEHHLKTKMQWNDNGTVTYRQIRTWNFQPEKSIGPLDDLVTIVNPVAATIGEIIRTKVPAFFKPGANGFLKGINEKLFVTKTVNQIIFEGFDDPLLTALNDVKFVIKPFVPAGAFTDKFAFFYDRNGTDYVDGVFNMYTGAGDFSKMGVVHSWNYSTEMFFPGKCGKVGGGAGEFYPPHLQKTSIEMFSNDLCRSLKFTYNGTASPSGIEAYEYVAGPSLFANGTENQENSCYNPPNRYLPSGVYNTSLCRFGAPVFISLPHFYQADPYYSSRVEGMKPEPALHSTFLRLEPTSGIPVDVKARFQMNVLINKINGISMFESVQKSFVPIMWFENSASVPPNMINKMKLLSSLQEILGGMGWGMVGVVLGFLVILGLKVAFRRRPSEEAGPILEDVEDDTVEEDNENVFKD